MMIVISVCVCHHHLRKLGGKKQMRHFFVPFNKQKFPNSIHVTHTHTSTYKKHFLTFICRCLLSTFQPKVPASILYSLTHSQHSSECRRNNKKFAYTIKLKIAVCTKLCTVKWIFCYCHSLTLQLLFFAFFFLSLFYAHMNISWQLEVECWI